MRFALQIWNLIRGLECKIMQCKRYEIGGKDLIFDFHFPATDFQPYLECSICIGIGTALWKGLVRSICRRIGL